KHLIDHEFSITERCYRVKRKYPDADHRIRPQRFSDIGVGRLHPAAHVFSGDIYVLIDGGSFSATCLASACLHYYHRAVFIGEETGGCEYAQGGYFVKSSFELPHTHLRFSMTNSMSVGKTDMINTSLGVKPDYFVPLTIDDILKQRDPAMDFAKRLIAEKK
ncbi:MAG TPA: S41 family peptidase, partial [Bacteroidia bacterium]|nr:S41 family peptidase [Bacteroidia bacterium]